MRAFWGQEAFKGMVLYGERNTTRGQGRGFRAFFNTSDNIGNVCGSDPTNEHEKPTDFESRLIV